MNSSVLMQLGQNALKHQEALEIVKKRVGVEHNYFDCWIYGFLENKNFNIEETVAKLIRRDAMERNELANHEITDFMRTCMRQGIIQHIGDDKEGRTTFYIVTNRDHPVAKRREENKRTFDMWVSFGSRLRKENQKCRLTMLINQTDASMWSNTDMTFQADVALRIAKFYPGVVDRMYITKMSNTLATLAKPIFSRLPAVVSDRIQIITDSDIAKGKLLELFDENILPVALGGKNNCDCPSSWNAFEETISRHYTSLKAAVKSGKGVKEWELEELLKEEGCEESISQKGSEKSFQRASRHNSGNHRDRSPGTAGGANANPGEQDDNESSRDDLLSDDRSMMTCETEIGDGDYDGADDAFRLHVGGRSPANRLSDPTRIDEWNRTITSGVAETTHCDALNLLEQHERTFRGSMEELQASQFLSILERWSAASSGFASMGEESEIMLGVQGSSSIVSHFPKPIRSVIRGALWVVCIIIAFYFLLATLFAASVGCSMMALFFFGMMTHPYYVYPFGFAMLVAGYQTSTLCARGYELVRTSFTGRMFHFLRPLGARLGLKIQSAIFFLVILTLFAVFCKYSADFDPITGIQYSVACGWIICSTVILLYHLLFVVGVRGDENTKFPKGRLVDGKQTGNKNLGGVSLYLFLDVKEKYEDVDGELVKSQRSYYLAASVPIAIAFLAGVAMMISPNVVFLVGCISATVASGYFINFLTQGDSWDHSATLMRLVICFASTAWMYCSFTIGFFGAGGAWGNSLALLLCTIVVWLIIAALAMGVRQNLGDYTKQWMFRIGWMVTVANVIASVVLLFTEGGWQVGVFILCLLLHSTVSFFRYGATSKVGSLTASVGFLAMLIACFTVGMSSDSVAVYTDPLSTGRLWNYSYGSAGSYSLKSTVQRGTPLFTACLSRFPTNLDIVAMSMFGAISYAAGENVLRQDLKNFFPTFAVKNLTNTFLSPLLQSSFSDESFVKISVFEDKTEENVTVISFSNSATRKSLYVMEALTMWTEAMAISPIGLVLPTEWTVRTVDEISNVATDFVAPLRWKRTMKILEDSLRVYYDDFVKENIARQNQTNSSQRLFIVGHDIAGGLAEVLGTRMGITTITFGAPGLTFSSLKYGLTEAAIAKYLTPVNSKDGTLTLVGGTMKAPVSLDCSQKTLECREATFYVSSLEAVCYPPS